MSDLEDRVALIEARNARVTYDKAWETSWARRGLVSGVIYGFGIILLNILGHEGAWKHAFVPVMGYLASTFSLPVAKKYWIERQERQKGTSNVTIH